MGVLPNRHCPRLDLLGAWNVDRRGNADIRIVAKEPIVSDFCRALRINIARLHMKACRIIAGRLDVKARHKSGLRFEIVQARRQ